MSSRTTTSIVTFLDPFVVAGYAGDLPAGEYKVLADDDAVLSQSFAADRRIAALLLTNWHAGKSECCAVDHHDLELALAQDRANTNENEIKNSAAALSPSEDQK